MPKIETAPPEKEIELNKEQAEATVREIWQQAYAMGANDSEYGAFKDILDDLESEKITPQQAVERARGILGSKQDYH